MWWLWKRRKRGRLKRSKTKIWEWEETKERLEVTRRGWEDEYVVKEDKDDEL